MNDGLKVGRILGIDVRIHWSWALVVLLGTWGAAAVLFPEWHPDWSTALTWTVALIGALLLFFAMLAHEFAHSLLARSRGLPVRGITLFVLGGADGEAHSAGIEFVIAITGPLTSLLLGTMLLPVGMVVAGVGRSFVDDPIRVFGQLGPVSTLILWFGSVNLVWGLLNLVPALPLDGGRVLRSALWKASNNRLKATRWTALTGQFFAWLFVLCGIALAFGLPVPLVVPLFGAGLVSGLSFMFIGWLLSRTARANFQEARTRELLQDVPVYRLMHLDVAAVSPDLAVNALVHDWIEGTDQLTFPVIDNGQMVGLVALEDVRKVKRDSWETAVVGEIMTPTQELALVTPGQTLGEALDKLSRGDLRQLLVVESGRLIGSLRLVDIVSWLRFKTGFVAG